MSRKCITKYLKLSVLTYDENFISLLMYQEKHDCGEAADILEERDDPRDDANIDELR